MADLSSIAQYDPPHFNQIFSAVTTGLCGELGGFESKVCVQEAMKYEGYAQNYFVSADPTALCQDIKFC